MRFTKLYNGSYHRNGIAGEGFFSLYFDWDDKKDSGKNFLITFTHGGERGLINQTTARVICLDDPISSWRGDNFAHDLSRHLLSLNITENNLYDFVTKLEITK